MKLVWCLFVVHLLFLVSGTFSFPRRKECGPNLERLLNNICNKIYNGPSKKSVYDVGNYHKNFQYDEYENEIPDELFDLYKNMPFYKNLKATTPFRYNRRRRGIVEECCYAPCSREELILYCGK